MGGELHLADIVRLTPDYRFHLLIVNGRMIWESMVTEGNVEGIEAEPFLTCILLIKGKQRICFLGFSP